jgi:hypothetical protein
MDRMSRFSRAVDCFASDKIEATFSPSVQVSAPSVCTPWSEIMRDSGTGRTVLGDSTIFRAVRVVKTFPVVVISNSSMRSCIVQREPLVEFHCSYYDS